MADARAPEREDLLVETVSRAAYVHSDVVAHCGQRRGGVQGSVGWICRLGG